MGRRRNEEPTNPDALRGRGLLRVSDFEGVSGFDSPKIAYARGGDAYDGLFYAQGTGAHFPLSVFLDESGDDAYQQELFPASTTMGAGNDFAVSLLLDLGGDDKMGSSANVGDLLRSPRENDLLS